MAKGPIIPSDYSEFLAELKERVLAAQVRASLSVNRELVLLYWSMGRDISQRIEQAEWGSNAIDRLATDLSTAFPNTKGFSRRNLMFMRRFAEAWPEEPIVKQLVSQIPWGHNVRLLGAVKDNEARKWYVEQTIENCWSRSVLLHQIDSDLYGRKSLAASNFQSALPAPRSDLAQQLLKDPYNFEFLTLAGDVRESELQRGLLQHIRDFMLELGLGFSFAGSQVHLEVGGEDFYLDLLFYHLKLRCFVVIDLKTGDFKPEYAGKMNFYLSAVDELLRHPQDEASIGIVLCRGKNRTIVEYSLREIGTPISVPEYRLTEALPEQLANQLPTIEELEARLHKLPAEPDTDT